MNSTPRPNGRLELYAVRAGIIPPADRAGQPGTPSMVEAGAAINGVYHPPASSGAPSAPIVRGGALAWIVTAAIAAICIGALAAIL